VYRETKVDEPKRKAAAGFIGQRIEVMEKLTADLREQIGLLDAKVSPVALADDSIRGTNAADEPMPPHSKLGQILLQHNMQLEGIRCALIAIMGNIEL
jgi:hypothetical protein